MSLLQLDLFEEVTELDLINSELKQLREAQNNLRRGIFARHHDLSKFIVDIVDRIDKLERKIVN